MHAHFLTVNMHDNFLTIEGVNNEVENINHGEKRLVQWHIWRAVPAYWELLLEFTTQHQYKNARGKHAAAVDPDVILLYNLNYSFN